MLNNFKKKSKLLAKIKEIGEKNSTNKRYFTLPLINIRKSQSILIVLCGLTAHTLKSNTSTILEKVRNVSRFYTE